MIEIEERTEKEQLMDWLDAQIEMKEHGLFFDNEIYNLSGICSPKTIHVSDVQKIADIIGYEVHTGEHSDEYKKRYIMYKGYEIFNLYVNNEENKNE